MIQQGLFSNNAYLTKKNSRPVTPKKFHTQKLSNGSNNLYTNDTNNHSQGNLRQQQIRQKSAQNIQNLVNKNVNNTNSQQKQGLNRQLSQGRLYQTQNNSNTGTQQKKSLSTQKNNANNYQRKSVRSQSMLNQKNHRSTPSNNNNNFNTRQKSNQVNRSNSIVNLQSNGQQGQNNIGGFDQTQKEFAIEFFQNQYNLLQKQQEQNIPQQQYNQQNQLMQQQQQQQMNSDLGSLANNVEAIQNILNKEAVYEDTRKENRLLKDQNKLLEAELKNQVRIVQSLQEENNQLKYIIENEQTTQQQNQIQKIQFLETEKKQLIQILEQDKNKHQQDLNELQVQLGNLQQMFLEQRQKDKQKQINLTNQNEAYSLKMKQILDFLFQSFAQFLKINNHASQNTKKGTNNNRYFDTNGSEFTTNQSYDNDTNASVQHNSIQIFKSGIMSDMFRKLTEQIMSLQDDIDKFEMKDQLHTLLQEARNCVVQKSTEIQQQEQQKQQDFIKIQQQRQSIDLPLQQQNNNFPAMRNSNDQPLIQHLNSVQNEDREILEKNTQNISIIKHNNTEFDIQNEKSCDYPMQTQQSYDRFQQQPSQNTDQIQQQNNLKLQQQEQFCKSQQENIKNNNEQKVYLPDYMSFNKKQDSNRKKIQVFENNNSINDSNNLVQQQKVQQEGFQSNDNPLIQQDTMEDQDLYYSDENDLNSLSMNNNPQNLQADKQKQNEIFTANQHILQFNEQNRENDQLQQQQKQQQQQTQQNLAIQQQDQQVQEQDQQQQLSNSESINNVFRDITNKFQNNQSQNNNQNSNSISLQSSFQLDILNKQSKENKEYVKAKYTFEGQKENDLNFQKGDVIEIVRKNQGQWFVGRLNNQIGYFPSNYVQQV